MTGIENCHYYVNPPNVNMKHTVCDSPVAPLGDAYRLDDEDHHLAEKHKEEEEEAEGAVSPKNEKTNISLKTLQV